MGRTKDWRGRGEERGGEETERRGPSPLVSEPRRGEGGRKSGGDQACSSWVGAPVRRDTREAIPHTRMRAMPPSGWASRRRWVTRREATPDDTWNRWTEFPSSTVSARPVSAENLTASASEEASEEEQSGELNGAAGGGMAWGVYWEREDSQICLPHAKTVAKTHRTSGGRQCPVINRACPMDER